MTPAAPSWFSGPIARRRRPSAARDLDSPPHRSDTPAGIRFHRGPPHGRPARLSPSRAAAPPRRRQPSPIDQRHRHRSHPRSRSPSPSIPTGGVDRLPYLGLALALRRERAGLPRIADRPRRSASSPALNPRSTSISSPTARSPRPPSAAAIFSAAIDLGRGAARAGCISRRGALRRTIDLDARRPPLPATPGRDPRGAPRGLGPRAVRARSAGAERPSRWPRSRSPVPASGLLSALGLARRHPRARRARSRRPPSASTSPPDLALSGEIMLRPRSRRHRRRHHPHPAIRAASALHACRRRQPSSDPRCAAASPRDAITLGLFPRSRCARPPAVLDLDGRLGRHVRAAPAPVASRCAT